MHRYIYILLVTLSLSPYLNAQVVGGSGNAPSPYDEEMNERLRRCRSYMDDIQKRQNILCELNKAVCQQDDEESFIAMLDLIIFNKNMQKLERIKLQQFTDCPCTKVHLQLWKDLEWSYRVYNNEKCEQLSGAELNSNIHHRVKSIIYLIENEE